MFGSQILDIAIGLVFVYLLFSLLCTAINELLSAWLKRRAAFLWKGIANLLWDPHFPGLAEKLYNHPLINALYPSPEQNRTAPTSPPASGPSSNSTRKEPSYIPSRTFTLALLDIIAPVNPGATSPPSAPRLEEIVSALNKLPPNSELRKALLVLIDEAGNDIEKVRKNIETWYDNTMERVSGWYKRRTQWITLALGLAIAIGVNVDTRIIIDSLSSDSALRASLVAAAQEHAKQQGTGQTSGNVQSSARQGTGQTSGNVQSSAQQGTGQTSGNVQPPAQQGTGQTPGNVQSSADRIKEEIKEIQKLGLPIGWTERSFKLTENSLESLKSQEVPDAILKKLDSLKDKQIRGEKAFLDKLEATIGKEQTDKYKSSILQAAKDQQRITPREWPGRDPKAWVDQIINQGLGWFLTAFAISLGAPFWFDLLNKLVNIRAAGKSPDEAAKVPKKEPEKKA